MAKKAKRSMAGLLLAASVALTATAAGNPSAAILRLLNSRSSGSPRDFAEAAEEVAAQAKEGKSVYAFVLGLISREPDAPPAAKLDAETQKRYLDENRPKSPENRPAAVLYFAVYMHQAGDDGIRILPYQSILFHDAPPTISERGGGLM